MRPIRLMMSAFGAYSAEQTVDFRELGGQRFFLIHGPTGSGKTTILDAICYALFGESSGSDRDGDQMRSHFAAPSTATFVEFDFNVGDRAFRARRRPRQQRPKRGGEGTTTEPAGATLWELPGPGEGLEGAVVLAAQPAKVTAEVQRIFGFGVEQFRQVILLPQDKFRDLLMADSSRREDLLQTLFQTHGYEQLQERLKERSRELRAKVEQVNHEAQVLLHQAACHSLDELRVIRAARVDEAATLAGLVERLRADETVAQRRLQAAVKDQETLDEQNAAAAQVAILRTNTAAIDAARRSVDAAKRAAALAPREAMLRQHRVAETARRDALRAAERLLADAAASHQKALSELTAWNARKPQRQGLHAQLVLLQGLGDQVARIEQADKDLVDAEQHLAQSLRLCEASAIELGAAEAALAAATGALGLAKAALAGLQAAEFHYERVSRQVRDRLALDDVRRSISELSRKHDDADSALAAARANVRDLKATLADLQRAYIDGHAAQLAGNLVDGQPCPVCGAVRHPVPAMSDRPVPPWVEVERRQLEVDRKAKEAELLANSAGALAAELSAKRATEQALIEVLADAGREPLPALLAKQRAARQQLESAANASRQAPDLEKAVGIAIGRRDRLTAAHGTLLGSQRSAETRLAACRAARDELVRGVPEPLRTRERLEAARTAAAGKLADLDRAIDRAEQAVQTTTAARQTSTERKTAAETELCAASRLAEQFTRDFARLREEAGFGSEHELAAARLDDAALHSLEERIAAHDQSLGAALARADRAACEAAGIQPPDLDGLARQAAGVKQALEQALSQRATAEQGLGQIDQLIANIANADQRLAQLEAEYAIVGKVADVATGNNGARLTFQRYVLSAMLDQVLETATTRLRLMSCGRYQLRRKLGPTDQRCHGGLDLEVFDQHTGKPRAAETLSGGEGFLASLSLALGLADVVARNAGSIRMETMFIDEGFGALDAEALDLAINTLFDLMSDGRLVGIISHVPELRERIDARLEIVATRGGSIARFAVTCQAR